MTSHCSLYEAQNGSWSHMKHCAVKQFTALLLNFPAHQSFSLQQYPVMHACCSTVVQLLYAVHACARSSTSAKPLGNNYLLRTALGSATSRTVREAYIVIVWAACNAYHACCMLWCVHCMQAPSLHQASKPKKLAPAAAHKLFRTLLSSNRRW
jgi:hypothetical protein